MAAYRMITLLLKGAPSVHELCATHESSIAKPGRVEPHRVNGSHRSAEGREKSILHGVSRRVVRRGGRLSYGWMGRWLHVPAGPKAEPAKSNVEQCRASRDTRFIRRSAHYKPVSLPLAYPSLPFRFLLRACVHDVKIVSSNKATLKIPILPIGSGPSPGESNNCNARSPTPTTVDNEPSVVRSGSNAASDSGNDAGEGEDSPGRESRDGEGGGKAGGESEGEETAGNDETVANGTGSASAAPAAAAPQAWSEGRTTWKGDALNALRTPLFVVEITVVGDKGSEMFAYTQRLAAVKESALALIDKAITSTQVRLLMHYTVSTSSHQQAVHLCPQH